MITAAQCRAARALLDWSQQQLAEAARVGVVTVRQFEGLAASPRHATLDVMTRALESAGVIFVAENGEGPGVRLKKGFTAAPRKVASAADVEASGTAARSMAADAADDVMKDVDASSRQKADRREALTEEPAMVDKARGKSDANR